jgi:hypothetical protein
MNSKEVAYFYMDANQLSYRAGMLPVGWCQICKKDWGLRHYAFLSLTVYRAVQCSKILCPGCAKKTPK